MLILTQLGFITCSATCLALIIVGLRYSLARSSFAAKTRQTILWGTIMGLIFWTCTISVLAFSGFLSDFSTLPPKMFLVLTIPLIGITWIAFLPGFKEVIRNIPGSWLIYIQSFRIIVELLLWCMLLLGITPVQMTFEGRNFDIIVGITAPIMAYMVYTKKIWSIGTLVVWNIGGLLLLGNIITIAILSFPTPFRQFMNDPPNTAVAEFPFVWLPGILVVVAYAMHFFSLRKIWLDKKET